MAGLIPELFDARLRVALPEGHIDVLLAPPGTADAPFARDPEDADLVLEEEIAGLTREELLAVLFDAGIEAGDPAEDAPFYDPSQPRHPAGSPVGGRWVGGVAAGTQAPRDTAHQAVRDFAGGKGPPTARESHAIALHLARLTVAQVHALKAELGLKASAPDKAALVAKVAQRIRGLRSQATAPEAAGGLPAVPETGKVYNAPVDALRVDPSRFQYKLNVNREGVTAELKSVTAWNPDFAGVVSVWKDPADGLTYVVNGHHRHELAARLGVTDMAVRYVKAGNATEARAVGALINIAEGRGTAVDAAKFMRDAGVGVADMERHGVSVKGKVAEDATALTRLSDRAFGRLTVGTLDQGKALAVARHLPDHALQDQLFGLLDKREDEGKDLSLKTVEEMAREVAQTPTHTKKEASLFGDIESEESLFVPRNELKAYVRSALSKEVNDFLAVSSQRRAERVGGAGNVLNVEENRRVAEQAERARNAFDLLVNRKGPISDAVNEAAARYAAAGSKRERDAVREQAVGSVRDAVFREAGIGPPGAGSSGEGAGGGGRTGAPERAAVPAEVPPESGGGSAGPAGLTRPAPHPAQVAAALQRYANRENTARGGGLFGGEDLQGRQGFARLPDGARIVFTQGEFEGRTGKIVRDTSGDVERVVAEVDGRPGLVPVDYTTVEPLNPALSWRTEASAGPLAQGSLLGAEHFLPRRDAGFARDPEDAELILEEEVAGLTREELLGILFDAAAEAGDSPEDAPFYDPSQPRHPAGSPVGGRWVGGVAAGTQAARDTAHQAVRDFAGGKGPPTVRDAHAIALHLARLTVAQIHALKKDLGIKGSAPNKAALVAKIAGRIRALRAASPAPAAAPAPPAAHVPAPAAAAPAAPEPGGYLDLILGTESSGLTTKEEAYAEAKKGYDQAAARADALKAQIKDWQGRQYKSNTGKVQVGGEFGPDVSVGQINESRRRRAIEGLQRQLQEVRADLDKFSARMERLAPEVAVSRHSAGEAPHPAPPLGPPPAFGKAELQAMSEAERRTLAERLGLPEGLRGKRLYDNLLARAAPEKATPATPPTTAPAGPPLPATPPAPGADRPALAAAVADKVLELAPQSRAGLVPIHEVRRQVSAPDRAAFDAAVRDLWREGKVRLVPLSDLSKATRQQLADGIPGVNETFFYLEPTGK